MQNGSWSQALAELLEAATAALVRFWKQDLAQLGLTVGLFLALATPLLLVVLVLWYLDHIGWRSSSGFYTIGWADHLAVEANLLLAGFAARRTPPTIKAVER